MIDINGIIIKRQPEIIEAFKKSIKSVFGVDADVSDEAVYGQLIGVFSEPISLIAEEFIAAILSTNPVSADGVWFDYCAAFNGLKRLPATPSVVDVGCYGDTGTIIDEGKVFGKSIDVFRFSVDKETVITPLDVNSIYLGIIKVAEGDLYSLDIFNGAITVTIAITATAFDDLETIKDTLLSELDNVLVLGTYLGAGNFLVKSKNIQKFSITINTPTTLNYGAVCPCTCTTLGDVQVKVGSINRIITPVSGLEYVINHSEGVRGRNIESTPEFKLRRDKALESYGSSNIDAIVSHIKNNVPGVSVCSGKENPTDNTVDGMSPHSIQIVVGGGDNYAIAQMIWDKKAGGIQTVGNVPVVVLDANGDGQQVRFSRPVTRYAWLRVQAQLYSEEIFPVDGIEQIRKNTLDYANQNYKIGLDLIPVRFYPAVLKVPGIEGLFVEVALTDSPSDTPLFTDTKIAIGNESFASFAAERIFVVIA